MRTEVLFKLLPRRREGTKSGEEIHCETFVLVVPRTVQFEKYHGETADTEKSYASLPAPSELHKDEAPTHSDCYVNLNAVGTMWFKKNLPTFDPCHYRNHI
jgi:hypothetical protein